MTPLPLSADRAGYTYRLLLVEIRGDPSVHFVAMVSDVVWMMQPGVSTAYATADDGWATIRDFEHQAKTTICGKVPTDYAPARVGDDLQCEPCMAGAADTFRDGRAVLAWAWSVFWPRLSRETALAELLERWRARPDAEA